MDADEMARKFAVGGETARDAFYDVIEALGEMQDPVSQSIAGVDLFGTMWEDLGPEVVTQLADIQNGYDQTKQTMQEINDVKYDDIGSALEGVKRSIQTNIFIPLSEEAMPTLNEFAKGAKESVKEVAKAFETGGMEGLAKAVGKQMSKGVTEIAKLSPTFIQAGVELVKGFAEGIEQNFPLILDTFGEMIATLAEEIGDAVPILSPITSAIALLGKNMQITTPVVLSLTAALLGMKTAKSVITTIEGLTNSFAAASTAARLFGSGMSTSLTAGQAAIGLMTRQVGAATTATTLFQSALTALGGPVGIAAAAIGVLAAGVVAYSLATDEEAKALKEIQKQTEKTIDLTDKRKESWKELQKVSKENIEIEFSEIDSTKKMVEELDSLVDANGKVVGSKERVKYLTDKINKMAPDSIKWVDDETIAYQENADAIQKALDKKKAMAAIENLQDDREEAEKKFNEALNSQKETLEQIADLEKQIIEKRQEANSETNPYKAMDLERELSELERQLEQKKEILEENKKEVEEYSTFIDKCNALEEAAANEHYDEINRILGEIKVGYKDVRTATTKELEGQVEDLETIYAILSESYASNASEYTKEQMEQVLDLLDSSKKELENRTKDLLQAQADAIKEEKSIMQESGNFLMQGLIEGIEDKRQAAVAKAAVVAADIMSAFTSVKAFNINSPSKWAYSIGGFVMEGLANGIEQNSKQTVDATNSMVKDIKSTVEGKKGFDVHSPSKYFYEIGSYLIQGMANGVSDNTQKVLQVMKELSSNALQEAKAKAADYKELGGLYSDSYLSGLEELFEGATELIKEGIDREIEAFEKAMQEETNVRVEALEAQIEALEEKKTKANEEQIKQQKKQLQKEIEIVKESSKEQIKANKEKWQEIEKAQEQAIKTAYSNIEDVLEERIDSVTSKFQKQYDEITSQKEAMESKLSSYGNLFEYGEEGKIVLNDIEQIRQGVQDYYEALDELKQKGASEDFLKEVLSYDIEDATKYIDELTSMSGTQLEQYLSDWEELQSLKMEGAKEQFESQYREVQRGFTLAVEEMNKEIPQLLLSVMEESLVGLKEDMPKEYGALYEKLLEEIQKKLNGTAQEGVTANIDVTLDKEQLEKTGEEAKEIIPGKEEAKASMQAAAEGIKEEEPTIEGNVKDVAETSVDVMTSYEGDFREIGNNYIDALITGMQDKYDQAVSVAGQIADAVKRELEEVAPFSDTEKENVEGTRNILESANNKQALLQKLFANVDNTRLNSMLRSMSDAVIAHQSYIARFSPVTTNNQSYQDNRVTKEGDIHFTVNTRQVNENDINKMMERANFERRKRNIAIGRK